MSPAAGLDNLPHELVNAIAHDAARDADRVGLFLSELGLRPAAGTVLRLPAGFLLDLGAALRLLVWQETGLQAQQFAGLPAAQEALRDVLGSLEPESTVTEVALPPSTLAVRVMVAFIDHFAWSGRSELDADVVLGEVDDAAVLEDLANFLWSHRPV